MISQSPSIGPLSYHRYRFTRNYKPAALHDGLELRSPVSGCYAIFPILVAMAMAAELGRAKTSDVS
jgi:hypothetical protein